MRKRVKKESRGRPGDFPSGAPGTVFTVVCSLISISTPYHACSAYWSCPCDCVCDVDLSLNLLSSLSSFSPSLAMPLPALSAAMTVSSARVPDSLACVSALAPCTSLRYYINSRYVLATICRCDAVRCTRAVDLVLRSYFLPRGYALNSASASAVWHVLQICRLF
jgi:hypothetical protein